MSNRYPLAACQIAAACDIAMLIHKHLPCPQVTPNMSLPPRLFALLSLPTLRQRLNATLPRRRPRLAETHSSRAGVCEVIWAK